MSPAARSAIFPLTSPSSLTSRARLAAAPFSQSYALTGDRLGVGSYGEVWRGVHLPTDTSVAVKVVDTLLQGLSSACDDALPELEVMAALGPHEALLGVREAFLEPRGKLHLVMDLMAVDLRSFLHSRRATFEELQVKLFFHKLLTGVAYMHSLGMAHRDIKLENIMLERPDDITSARLGDFGLASLPGLSPMRGKIGSLHYMAPEVIQPPVKVKARGEGGENLPAADMWAAGVVLYVMLGTQLPFTSGNIEEIPRMISACDYNYKGSAWGSVSGEAKDLIDRLFERDPSSRISATKALQHAWFDELRGEGERTPEREVHEQEATSPSTWKNGIKKLMQKADLSFKSKSPLAMKRPRSPSSSLIDIRWINRHQGAKTR